MPESPTLESVTLEQREMMLDQLDVLPDHSVHDCSNVPLPHTKLGSQDLRGLSRCRPGSNFQDLGFGQTGASVTGASGDSIRVASIPVGFGVDATPFRFHVISIIGICASKQMAWTNAGAIVAVVADEQPVRDRSNIPKVREAMGVYVASSVVETPVATTQFSCPHPAWTEIGTVFWNGTVLVDVGPETNQGVLGADPRLILRGAFPSTELGARTMARQSGGAFGASAHGCGTIGQHRGTSNVPRCSAPVVATNNAGASSRQLYQMERHNA